MKIQDLRVGNWLESDGRQFKITGHYISNVERGCSIDNGIPLTIEWVDAFYLNKIDNNNWRFSIYNIYFNGEKFMLLFVDKLNIRNLKEIKYVHQLQNLYYELMSEDLIIR